VSYIPYAPGSRRLSPVHVVALEIELRFPSSRSLKQKRSLLRPIVDGVRSRFAISVAEVAYQDTWQRSVVGVSLVGSKVSQVEAVADQVERFVWNAADTEVVRIDHHWLDIDS